MKNKLLLGLATATILAVGSDALINTSINQPQVLLAAKTKKKHHKKRQAAKYRPRLLKKHPAYTIGQSSLPDAKSLINTGKLPKGTHYSWKKKPEINQPDSYSSGDAKIKVTYPDHSVDIVPISFKLYGKNEMVMPIDYKLEDVAQADQTDHATDKLKKATEEGMDSNIFIAESPADDKEKVDFYHLTNDQKKRLNDFAVELINEARAALGAPSVSTDDEVLAAADRVASEYNHDHYSYDAGHDVDGLHRALDSYGGWAEDMDCQYTKPNNMTEMKEFVYNSIMAYLFNTISWEWHHAASIAGTDGGELSRVAVSYTKAADDMYVTHFIFLP